MRYTRSVGVLQSTLRRAAPESSTTVPAIATKSPTPFLLDTMAEIDGAGGQDPFAVPAADPVVEPVVMDAAPPPAVVDGGLDFDAVPAPAPPATDAPMDGEFWTLFGSA